MKTRFVDGVEVQRGSGNVFADLGVHYADKLKIKTGLVIETALPCPSAWKHSPTAKRQLVWPTGDKRHTRC